MKPVYTIDDLVSRAVLDAGAARPARLAVIGHPVAHSASPTLHQAALDAAGIDARYVRLDIQPGHVREALTRLRELGFIGCNVTVPHKLEVMECCELDFATTQLGAVNTVCFEGPKTRGFNTDGPGFAQAVAEKFNTSLGDLSVAIIGAGGGAGQAIATQCCLTGVKKLCLVNRTVDKLMPLEARLQQLSPDLEIVSLAFDDPALSAHCLASDLLVNTSSVGLKTGDPSILPAACLKKEHLLYDTIYQPPVTPLLALGNALGCRTENGLSMLIHQGALAFQHWFPGTEPLAEMQRAMAMDGR